MKSIVDWNGRPLELAESTGGVLAFTNPLAGLLRGGVWPWPPSEVIQKLYRSRQERAFLGENLEAVRRGLGFYCDLQSVHSEDAITWSVFGPVAHAPASERIAFCRALFQAFSLGLPAPKAAEVALWRRMPHPDTLVPGGPEADFLIQTGEVAILGEAKWLSGVGVAQGKNRDKNQIVLRTELFAKYGEQFFPGARHFVVLVVGLTSDLVQPESVKLGNADLELREVTWESLCSLMPHPASDELPAYYRWKLEHSRRGRGTSSAAPG